MKVRELKRDALNELKEKLFYQLLDVEIGNEVMGLKKWEDLKDETIFNFYNNNYFTNDDFFCNIEEEKEIKTNAKMIKFSMEQIKKSRIEMNNKPNDLELQIKMMDKIVNYRNIIKNLKQNENIS